MKKIRYEEYVTNVEKRLGNRDRMYYFSKFVFIKKMQFTNIKSLHGSSPEMLFMRYMDNYTFIIWDIKK